MEREIHLLENMTACKIFSEKCITKGISIDQILGVGTFASYIIANQEGLSVKSTPTFLEQDIVDGIVNGYLSPYEQDSVLFQVQENSFEVLSITKWLMFGLHFSLFQPNEMDLMRYLQTKDLLNVSTPQEFIQVFLNFLFQKIYKIKPQAIVILLDIPMFSQYIKCFFQWLFYYTGNEKLLQYKSFPDLEKIITNEFVYFLSDIATHPLISLLVQNRALFETILQYAHESKKYIGNVQNSLKFKYPVIFGT